MKGTKLLVEGSDSRYLDETHLDTIKGTPCLFSALIVTESRIKHRSVRNAELRSALVGCVSNRPKLSVDH